MRNPLIFLFSFVISVAFGQTDPGSINSFQTTEQNQEWLTNLKKADRSVQLAKIQERFLDPSLENSENNAPVIIIDGIPLFQTNLTEKKREFLLTHLTTDYVKDLSVMDEEPEDLYINKKFTGIVVLTFRNKRTANKWQKLN